VGTVERSKGCYCAGYDRRIVDNAAVCTDGPKYRSDRAGRTFYYSVMKQPLEANASGGFSTLFGQLFLEIIDKVLRVCLGKELTGLVRHVGFLTKRLELIPLCLYHHQFFGH
jgi:hypothetical protein